LTAPTVFSKLASIMAPERAQFDQMEASLLYCPTCRQATPVRKRLLLVLMEGEKFDYVCTRCGTVSGDKIERPAPRRR
jgi:uncharacterized Zn finger protein